MERKLWKINKTGEKNQEGGDERHFAIKKKKKIGVSLLKKTPFEQRLEEVSRVAI